MKKIIYEFIESLADGGAETLVKDYVRLIDKNLFEAKIITLHIDTHTANYKQVIESSVEVYTVYKHWNIFTRIFNKLFGRKYVAKRIKELSDKDKPICIHIHLALLKYLMPISKDLLNVNLCYTCHSLPSHLFGGKNVEERRAAEYLIKNNKLQMIAINPTAQIELNDMFNIDNTIFIRNGIDYNKFRNSEINKDSVRKELNIPADSFVVGHVARFAPYKNHSFLIDIFYEICKIKPDSRLILIGTGPTKLEIEEKVNKLGLSNKVLFMSARSDVYRILKAFDAFVYPAFYEGLGIVMIEAQVSGVHCVLSDKVAAEAFISPLAIPMSIEESPQKWALTAIDTSLRSDYPDRTLEYDLNREIKRIENIYSRKKDE